MNKDDKNSGEKSQSSVDECVPLTLNQTAIKPTFADKNTSEIKAHSFEDESPEKSYFTANEQNAAERVLIDYDKSLEAMVNLGVYLKMELQKDGKCFIGLGKYKLEKMCEALTGQGDLHRKVEVIGKCLGKN